MSNVVQLFRHGSFDPEHLKAMGEAFDLCVKMLPDHEHKAAALAILAAARAGERDCARLCELAIDAPAERFNSA